MRLALFLGADSDLAQLCNGNLARISHLSQAKNIIAAIKSTIEPACAQFEDSLRKLEPILEDVDEGRLVCNVELVDKVRQYHTEFISTKSFLIPEALRRFFIVMCFEISRERKANLPARLAEDTRDKLSEEDYATLDGPAKAEAESSPRTLAYVLLVEDIKKLAGKQFDNFKVLVSVPVGEALRKMMRV